MSRSRRMAAWVVALSTAFALQGCGLPRSGPMSGEVADANQSNTILLVPVTPEIAATSREADQAGFPAAFLSAPAVDYERLAPGDGVDVTIWERDGLGMFPAGPTGVSDLGELVLDKTGAIYLPYLGRIDAKGLTAAELRSVLVRRLRGIVIATDVGVRATDRHGQIVTMQGNLSKAGAYPIDQGTQRLSGVLALASPNQQNPEQLAITVRRGGMVASVRLSDVYRDSEQDIALRPGDSIVVHDVVKYLTVLGAAGGQGRVKLTKRNYSVLDALGDSRGLNDTLANPRAIFLFRSRLNAEAVGPDARPTIYQFDFTQPEQMILAGEFVVRDGDAIYISDAPFTQVQKLLSTFSATLSTARSVGSLTP